jgi:nitroimidazol reductase NimA-like FMN-containing flavoprotein (pyridoxamine 5'-phosphate oxidase superfamily)
VYEQRDIEAVLDSEQICHVAWVENGEPRMVPTLYFRDGNEIFLHGNRQSATLGRLAEGGLACITVTLVDGVVVARSGFHCSMNYRSVTLFGNGRRVEGEEEARRLDQFVDRLIPGHLPHLRAPTAQEIAATMVVAVRIDEASAKIRTGDSIDAEEDLDAPVWAGVIPVRQVPLTPVANHDLKPGIEVPDYIVQWRHPDDRRG